MKVLKYEIPDSAKSYRPSEPFTARILGNERLTEEDTDVDIRNIILDISDSNIEYLEGQSIGVIVPGTQENGRPHRVRLYSIASSRNGDHGCGLSVTLCVKRVVFDDEDGNEVRGLTSNYLCDTKIGDKITIIGPTGRTFFLPQDENVNLIMVAAGTGIAPFRAFIHRIYKERKSWKGRVILYYGVRNAMENIYMNRENDDLNQYMTEETFEAFQTFSSEISNGKRTYVQHKIAGNQEDIWNLLKEGNFSFYLCGMKNMEKSVDDVFAQRAAQEGLDWAAMKKEFRQNGRWNIEVY